MKKRLQHRCFPVKFCEVFKNTYFEEHLQTTASEFIGDITLFHDTILKKNTNGKTNFQDGKVYNRKQHLEWWIKTNDVKFGSADILVSFLRSFSKNVPSTKKKCKDLPKVNQNIQTTWQTLLWYPCCQTDICVQSCRSTNI